MFNRHSATKLVAGAAIGAPALALAQGVYFLVEYRFSHKDAPEPVSPASGVVVVSPRDAPEESTETNGPKLCALLRRSSKAAWRAWRRRPVEDRQHILGSMSDSFSSPAPVPTPLRLLVVGDSLAVGVGTSQSGTPILPESIARALSKAMGGRAVYWTCIGTAGASAGRIVRDIESFHKPTEEKSDALVTQQERDLRLQQVNERLQKWFEKQINCIGLRRRSSNNGQESADETQRTINIALDIKKLFDKRFPKLGLLEGRKQVEIDDTEKNAWRQWRARSATDSSASKAIQEYDVAVVLTGLNDLKESVLPFMFSHDDEEIKARRQKEKDIGIAGYEGELFRILFALKDKMNGKRLQEAQNSASQEKIPGNISANPHPLIVLPGLPVSAVPAFQWAPLRWLALPLFRQMDESKRKLSLLYPASVLFVESPTVSAATDFEAGKGRIFSRRRAEHVLVALKNVSQRASEQVKEAMDKYHRKFQSPVDHEEKEKEDQFEQSYHQHSSSAHSLTYSPPGRKLFAVDNIHPNDDGYDFYGRHIAASVIKEWSSSR